MHSKYTKREIFTIFIICVLDVLLYLDRFSTISQAKQISRYFKVKTDYKKRLQRAFLFGYTLTAPIFGYLGDRYSRKTIMIVSALVWSLGTLLGTIAKTGFGLFLLTRGFTGIAQAGFCTVYPSVLADIVRHNALNRVLTYVNLLVPIGNLFGILLKDLVLRKIGEWWYSHYIKAALVFIAALFVLIGIEPKRGFKDVEELLGQGKKIKATSYKKDMKTIFRNKTVLLTLSALTCVYFFDGIVKWYGPEFLLLGGQIISERGKKETQINAVIVFASVSLVSGLIGVPLGSFWSRQLKPVISNIDPMICGMGILMSVPFIGVALLTIDIRSWETIYYIFLAQTLFNMIWAVASYTLLLCVIPTRRCSVRGWQILISRLFGDYIGPYIMLNLRLLLYHNLDFETAQNRFDIPDIDMKPFYTLRTVVFIGLIVNFIGSILFLCDAAFINSDAEKVKQEIIEMARNQMEEG